MNKLFFATAAFSVGLILACKIQKSAASLESNPQAAQIYSGYLPENPKQKVYITVADGRILNIASTPPSVAATVVSTDDWIFPGLIDLHNHPHYGAMPLLENLEGQYSNRYEWRIASPAVQNLTKTFRSKLSGENICNAALWAEWAAIVGGTTSIQGISEPFLKCAKGKLTRNIESRDEVLPNENAASYIDVLKPELWRHFYSLVSGFPQNPSTGFTTEQYTPPKNSIPCNSNSPSSPQTLWTCDFEKFIRTPFLKDSTNRTTFVHMAEGRHNDPFASFEYSMAEWLGYNAQNLIIIHGVGLNQKHIDAIATRKGSIAWSPSSNLLLYGETLDIPKLINSGVNIVIGPDWAPSGTKNVLEEMRFAYNYSLSKGWGLYPSDFLAMATKNAAQAIRAQNEIGTIKQGAKADLLFATRESQDAASDLLKTGEAAINLVVIDGNPVFGEVSRLSLIEHPSQIVPLKTLSACPGQKAFLRSALHESSVENVVQKLANVVRESYAEQSFPLSISNTPHLFACEDAAYLRILEKTLHMGTLENFSRRAQLRQKAGLITPWNPLYSAMP